MHTQYMTIHKHEKLYSNRVQIECTLAPQVLENESTCNVEHQESRGKKQRNWEGAQLNEQGWGRAWESEPGCKLHDDDSNWKMNKIHFA